MGGTATEVRVTTWGAQASGPQVADKDHSAVRVITWRMCI